MSLRQRKEIDSQPSSITSTTTGTETPVLKEKTLFQRYFAPLRNVAIGLALCFFSRVDNVLDDLYQAAFIHPQYQHHLSKSNAAPWWFNFYTIGLPIGVTLSVHLFITFTYLQYINSSRSSYQPSQANQHLQASNLRKGRQNKLDFENWDKDPILKVHIPRATLSLLFGLGIMNVLATLTSGVEGIGGILGLSLLTFGVLSCF